MAAGVASVLVTTPALALTKEEKRLLSCQDVMEELLLRAGYRVPPTALGLVELLRGVSPRKPLPDED